jgi:integrase
MTAQGRPFSGPGFSNWFAESAAKAGLPAHSSPHGLRKAASRWLAEAGATAFEIAAITGHASLKEVERYTKSASQKRLAATAMARMEKPSA